MREFRNQLRAITEKAGGAEGDYKAKIEQQLVDVERSLPPIWADGELLSLLGDAWAALGDFEKGIDCYRRALTDEGGKVTLWSLQQYANLLARYARNLAGKPARTPPKGARTGRGKGGRKADPFALLEEAEDVLQNLLRINRTVELLSLFGSLYKNWARIDESQRITRLRQAADRYREAYDLAIEKTGEPDPYPGLNWMTCRFIADQLSAGRAKGAKARTKQDKTIRDEMARIRDAAEKSMSSDNLWKRTYLPDAELFAHLIGNSLNRKSAEVVIEKYRFAVKGRADEREIESVRGQFDFITGMLKPVESRVGTKLELLQTIRDAIGK
jgi:tetratricopeptide (TPR) repeat protein